MKDKNKRIRMLAEKIYKLEKDIILGKNVKENQNKIEEIMTSLTIEELLKINFYISKCFDKEKNF